ncbi:hypothetical protein SLS62_008624 [Diatrype stigma]|uniref:Uncharacterized protein n=1 Tax=Diatrype stigma TaxID=117547 RepID=A0AAN9UI75_9PEZI
MVRITATSLNADGSIKIDQLEDDLSAFLGHMFDEISQTNEALVAKLFGGTPKKDVDLMQFLEGMDPWYKQVSTPIEEYEPVGWLYVSP